MRCTSSLHSTTDFVRINIDHILVILRGLTAATIIFTIFIL